MQVSCALLRSLRGNGVHVCWPCGPGIGFGEVQRPSRDSHGQQGGQAFILTRATEVGPHYHVNHPGGQDAYVSAYLGTEFPPQEISGTGSLFTRKLLPK